MKNSFKQVQLNTIDKICLKIAKIQEKLKKVVINSNEICGEMKKILCFCSSISNCLSQYLLVISCPFFGMLQFKFNSNIHIKVTSCVKQSSEKYTLTYIYFPTAIILMSFCNTGLFWWLTKTYISVFVYKSSVHDSFAYLCFLYLCNCHSEMEWNKLNSYANISNDNREDPWFNYGS